MERLAGASQGPSLRVMLRIAFYFLCHGKALKSCNEIYLMLVKSHFSCHCRIWAGGKSSYDTIAVVQVVVSVLGGEKVCVEIGVSRGTPGIFWR